MRTLTSRQHTAIVTAALQQEWPETRFVVRPMGDAVLRVIWGAGPARATVDALVSKYRGAYPLRYDRKQWAEAVPFTVLNPDGTPETVIGPIMQIATFRSP